MNDFFQFKANNTTLKTEILAGINTFVTMTYILAVNHEILSVTGMHRGAVFSATAFSSVIATIQWALLQELFREHQR
ncbi:MAG: hypothetical protein AB2L20_32720 [Mangrovibacterium sp.]